MNVRILLVEDSEPFRRFLRAELGQRAGFEIVGEATDGPEAVQLAETLAPDVILLDIGLPTMNGMEAARRIRRMSPQPALVFVSQETSPDVVEEAFRLGASGYVGKQRAKDDLLRALDAALGGPQIANTARHVLDAHRHAHHDVHFYSDDSVFLERTANVLGGALSAGNPVVMLATSGHRHRLLDRMRHQGVDIDRSIRDGIYVEQDAAYTLSQIMTNHRPDLDKFLVDLNRLVTVASQAARTPHRVTIVGECVALLCEDGRVEAALQLERAGNDLLKTHPVDVLCAYPMKHFPLAQRDPVFRQICAEHTTVVL